VTSVVVLASTKASSDDAEAHPHNPAGSPKGGQFAKKGHKPPAGTKQPPKRREPARKPAAHKAPVHQGGHGKPAGHSASKPATHTATGRLPNLKQGANNNPARVKQLQALIAELKLGKVAVDGQYGQDTEDAVKDIQRKLGLKPTGRASNALVRRLHDAHALSPCVGKSGSKVHASAAVDFDEDLIDVEEVDGEYVDTLAGDAFDLIRWSDGTMWLTDDGETGLLELDDNDAQATAEALQVGEDTVVSGWLLVASTDTGGAVLTADDVEVELQPDDVDAFVTQLLGEPVAAAAGKDVTPGHDELHHYWTVGPGRREWVDSPTPWTTLLALLVEHVKPPKPVEVLKRWASAWFKEVKGYSAGSDKNRVAHGHPPRGHVVGPG